MPDEVTDAQAPASASTESSPVLSIPKDEASYAEWRKTGKLPESKEKPKEPEESAPREASAEAEEAEGKHASASEAENQQEKPKPARSDAATRLNEILSDLKRAGLSPSELKSFKREAQQTQQAKPSETTAQPPAAKQPEPPKELKEPKLEDFTTWEEYRKADREYNRELGKQDVQAAIAEYVQQQQAAQANQQAQAKLNEAKQRYGEEAEASITSAARSVFNDAQIHPDIKYLVNQSSVLADLLYVMGSNQADFDNWIQTAKTNPGEAIRRLVTMENLVIEELKKPQSSNGHGEPPERDESGKFVGKSPAKRISEAPPPAREVSGKASPPANEVDRAFTAGDVRGYINAANRRDLAIKQGR